MLTNTRSVVKSGNSFFGLIQIVAQSEAPGFEDPPIGIASKTFGGKETNLRIQLEITWFTVHVLWPTHLRVSKLIRRSVVKR